MDFEFKLIKKYLTLVTIVLASVIMMINIISAAVEIKNIISNHINNSTYEINSIANEIKRKIRVNEKLASQIFLEPEIADVLNMRNNDVEAVSNRLQFYLSSDYYLESIYVYNENDNCIYSNYQKNSRKYDVNKMPRDKEIANVIREECEKINLILRKNENGYIYTFIVRPYVDSNSVVIMNYYKNYFNLDEFEVYGDFFITDKDGYILVSSDGKIGEYTNGKIFERAKESIDKISTFSNNGKVVVCLNRDDVIYCNTMSIGGFLKKSIGVIIVVILCTLMLMTVVIFSFSGALKWILRKFGQFHYYTEFTEEEMQDLKTVNNYSNLKMYIRDGNTIAGKKIKINTDREQMYNIFEIYIDKFQREKTKVDERERYSYNYAIRNIFQELSQGLKTDVLEIKPEEIIILCNSKDREATYEQILKTKSIVQEVLEIQFTIIKYNESITFGGVPKIYYSFSDLHDWCFYKGTNSIIELSDCECENADLDLIKLKNQILTHLNEGQTGDAVSLIELLYTNKMPPRDARKFLVQLLTEFGNICESRHFVQRKKALEITNSIINCIENDYGWSEIIREIGNLSEFMKEVKATTENEQANDRVEQIVNIINSHYSDANFSRETVAEMFGVSSKTLDKLFKKYKNQSITSYIFTYRMEVAKKLLDETSLSVNDIAEKVGYLYVSHFIQNFKKTYRMTPDKYRISGTKDDLK